MNSELEQLLVLQDRQQKIRQIQTEIKTLPLERDYLESQLAATAAGVESLKQKGRQVEVDRKRLELNVGNMQIESISRLRTKQYLKPGRIEEFRAIGDEIERYELKSANSRIRVESMLEADKVKGDSKRPIKTRGLRSSISRQLTDLETKSKALETRQAGALTNEREALASKIDADLLDQFERLFNSKATLRSSPWSMVFAPLPHENNDCHSGARESGRSVNCEQCGRILYLGQ